MRFSTALQDVWVEHCYFVAYILDFWDVYRCIHLFHRQDVPSTVLDP